ncbi:MAG: hypothetical protein KJ941_02915 [Bacteroidetes bacterium]|nr:hypothetical protein [Bacteroidota bacterium]
MLIKICCLIVFTLGVLGGLFSQPPEKINKWALGFIIAPTANYRLLVFEPKNQFVKKMRDSEEVLLAGFQSGLTMHYQMNQSWSVSSGAIFSIRGFSMAPTTPDNELVQNDIKTLKSKTLYQFIDFPLGIDYCLKKKNRSAITFGGGLIIAKFLRQKNVAIRTNFDGSKEYNQNFKNGGFSRLAALPFFQTNIEFFLSTAWSANIGVRLEAGINSIEKSNNKTFLYSGGLQFSVKRNL